VRSGGPDLRSGLSAPKVEFLLPGAGDPLRGLNNPLREASHSTHGANELTRRSGFSVAGRVIRSGGQVSCPGGQMIRSGGQAICPTGQVIRSAGQVICPTGQAIRSAGQVGRQAS
jgi:hypothetical protein